MANPRVPGRSGWMRDGEGLSPRIRSVTNQRLEDSTPFPSALDGAFRTGRLPLTRLTPSLTPRRPRSRR